jgi:4-hydroxyphenylacetate 3-monooxygenase oxygenase component
MPARTGAELLRGLKDGRQIWVGDDKVTDVVSHPAFSGAAKGLAAVFDLQWEAPDDCLFPDPETGELINVSHMIPKSPDDVKRRHRGLRRIAEHTVGVMGRTPDYMNVTYAGFAGCAHEWAEHGNEAGAARQVEYQKYLRRNDICLTHTLIHPTIDKAKDEIPGLENDVILRKVCDTEHGIIVRGARILATLAPFADELAVYPARPLPENGEKFAVSFCIPMATPGLKFICRDSVAGTDNVFDHPLSSRFDEQDAFLIFDDVEVPRDRLFIDANVKVYNQTNTRSWHSNVMQQTMIRAATKLEFAWGLATALAESINDKSPAAQQMLGELWCYAELARSAIQAAEDHCNEWGNGVWFPDGPPLMALKAMMPFWMPRANEIIKLLGSHNLLATPTWKMMHDPELRPYIDKYLHGANETTAERRVRLFRLAWDYVGTALASRVELYERFYLTSGARNQQRAQSLAKRDSALKLVERFLTEPVDPE